MYKIYLKQAFQILRQNKLISIVSIAGTALAIMMIMVIILTEQIKNVSIAPEPNRNRTLYSTEMSGKNKTNSWSWSGGIEYDYYENYLSKMEVPERVSILSSQSSVIKREDSKDFLNVIVSLVDANFWKIMSLDFLEGKPFNEEEDDAMMKYVIISHSVAEQLFGKNAALNETIEINFIPYKVIGIVRDALPVFTYAQADIWIPYASLMNYEELNYHILFLAKNRKDFQAIKEEVRELERRQNALNEEWDYEFNGPYNHKEQIAISNSWDVKNTLKKANRRMIILFAVLLLVPAVNLSSFSMSQIRKRTEEIGVRKAFGATKREIIKQVLYENLATSFIGGFIGLILSYVAVLWFKNWLLGIKSSQIGVGEINSVPLETFLSPWVFLSVVLACILLNLISAAIPAYRASRLSIVNSLTQNEE